jgi:hypothetical protein
MPAIWSTWRRSPTGWDFEKLLDLAADKDAGFDRHRFADALSVAAEEPEAEFRRLGLSGVETAELRERARAWAAEL